MECKALPIESDYAEMLYTSHTIEHISDAAVQNLFNEAYRTLKPGGFFRVTTGPDADTDFAALVRNDKDWFYWDTWYDKPGTYENIYQQPACSVPLEERWLHHIASQLAPNNTTDSAHKFNASEIKNIINDLGKEKALDYFTGLCSFNPLRVGNHISRWNATKIIDFLKIAGFKIVYKSGYGQSFCPILRNVNYFDNTHPQMSVYVEAIK
jgi:hypothetical protein